MKSQCIMVFLMISIQSMDSFFSRPNNVYEHVIHDIQKYYHSHSIYLFYASPKYATTFDVAITKQLINLQLYFINNSIYTSIIDIRKLTDQQHSKIKNVSKKSLFVFLHDIDGEKSLFNDLVSSFDISSPTWIFFFDNTITIDEFFINTYIPYNSEFLVSVADSDSHEVITEIYRINETSELKKNILALWSLDDGMKLSNANFYERRNNLFGHNFRVAIVADKIYTSVSYTENNEIQVGGFIGEVMEYLKTKLNFTITYQLTQGYGIRLDNGSWIGGIADLVNNISDIFASSIAMTSTRYEVIDFTVPLTIADDYFFFKKPGKEDVNWIEYLQPFQSDIWIMIICVMFITSSIVTVILTFYKRIDEQILIKNRESYFFSDNIFFIFGAFCGQAIHRSFINSVFIIHFTLHITATIILAAYSAILTSTLTVSDFKVPFTTLQGFYEDGTYKMGYVKSSIYADLFQLSNDSIMVQIHRIGIKFNTMTTSLIGGMKRICTEYKYAFMAPKYAGYINLDDDCILIPSQIDLKLSKCMGVNKNNPFRGLLNYHITHIKEYGILDRMIQKAVQKPDQPVNTWESVEIVDILPLLVLLMINSLLSFIILWIEKQIYKKILNQRLSNLSQFLIKHTSNISKKKTKLSSLKI